MADFLPDQKAPGDGFYNARPSIEQEVAMLGQEDINAPVLASPKEQAQYEDLVSRVVLAMSDSRVAKGMEEQGSPADTFIQMMRRPNLPLESAIGMAVAEVTKLVYMTGKRQGYEYDSEVLMEAAQNPLPHAAYLLAKAAGVVENGPPSIEEGGTPAEYVDLDEIAADNPVLKRQLEETDAREYFESGDGALDIEYDWSQEELDFLEKVTLEGAKHFGEYLIKTGQIDQQAWQKMLMQQIEKEEAAGLNDGLQLPGQEDIARVAEIARASAPADPAGLGPQPQGKWPVGGQRG